MNKRIILVFVLVIFTSFGFAQKKKKGTISEQDQISFNNGFMEANKQKMLGNYDLSLKLYQECLKYDPQSAVCYYEIGNILFYSNKLDEAIPFLKQSIKLNETNYWYKLQLVNVYQRKQMMEESAELLKLVIKENPQLDDYYYDLATVYIYLKKYKEAISVLNQIEKKIGITEQVSLQKEAIYTELGQYEKAIEELKRLIDFLPNETRYKGLLAEIYVAKGEDLKAIEMYNKILEKDPNNGLVHLSLADFYRMQKDLDKSYEELKLAFASQDVDVDIKVKMLASFFNYSYQSEELKTQAYTLLDIMLAAHPDDPKANTIYADYLVRDKEYAKAKEKLLFVVKTEKDKYLIWEQLFFILNELRDLKELNNTSKEAAEYFPTQPLVFFFKGVSAMELNQLDEAKEALITGNELVIENDALKAQFYTYLGEIYYKQKNYPESDKNFDALLKLQPDNKYVLNNYSYYLSLRGEFLDKAEKMSKKIVDAEPENSTYLDTYGWVLYKQNKLQEAKEILNKSIKLGGDKSAVIIEHLGDILFKLGETEEAIKQWKKAKETGKGTDLLDKKIKENKLIE